MKKLIISALMAVVLCFNLQAWGSLGHRTVIAVAQRHLTEKTKANIAKYMDYDLKKDAVWMDKHRKDEPIAYTTAWHVYNVDVNHNYDPNPRQDKGDAIYALNLADYNLSHYKELSDSAVVMNIRMVIHFAGDMHCPVHSYFPGPRNFWPFRFNGEDYTSFHAFYDGMPERLWPDADSDELAAKLDNCNACQRKKITRGNFYDWARACGDRNVHIYDINAPLTKELDPDTVEKSREIISLQLRDAGYRLAFLLNKYFGK